MDRQRVLWTAVSGGCGIAAGLAARQIATTAWKTTLHREPPDDPADRATSLQSALLWAVAVGVGAGVTRVVATRLAAGAWELAVDEPPPGVGSD